MNFKGDVKIFIKAIKYKPLHKDEVEELHTTEKIELSPRELAKLLLPYLKVTSIEGVITLRMKEDGQ